MKVNVKAQDKTIRDFGKQWTTYDYDEGYYQDNDSLQDKLGPVLDLRDLRGKRVADVGSGTGRCVHMFLDAGAEHVYALEPSEAFDRLKLNTAPRSDRITYLRGQGQELPPGLELDYVFFIGVLHHIENPAPALQAAKMALREGGRLIVWVYGKEGNRLYLALVTPVRFVTRRLPHHVVAAMARFMNLLLDCYMFACRFLPLPLHDYLNHYLSKCSRRVRFLTIYDQLKPETSVYYCKDDIIHMVQSQGFVGVTAYHFKGYSWTVVGAKARPHVSAGS